MFDKCTIWNSRPRNRVSEREVCGYWRREGNTPRAGRQGKRVSAYLGRRLLSLLTPPSLAGILERRYSLLRWSSPATARGDSLILNYTLEVPAWELP